MTANDKVTVVNETDVPQKLSIMQQDDRTARLVDENGSYVIVPRGCTITFNKDGGVVIKGKDAES